MRQRSRYNPEAERQWIITDRLSGTPKYQTKWACAIAAPHLAVCASGRSADCSRVSVALPDKEIASTVRWSELLTRSLVPDAGI
jgi:hypothetical protein